MTAFYKYFVVCVLCWSVSAGAQGRESWATVKGRVIDSEGQPVANSRISIFPMRWVYLRLKQPTPVSLNAAPIARATMFKASNLRRVQRRLRR